MTDPGSLLERQLMLANALVVGWPELGLPGLPRSSVAAIVGNATQENQARSTTEGAKDHGSDGLFQWRLDRLANLKAFAAEHFEGAWDTIRAQAAFFAYECKRDYPGLMSDLVAGTKSVATLTANICDIFERPAAASAMLDKRIGYATDFLKAWAGEPAPPAVITSPTPTSPPAPSPADPGRPADIELGALAAILDALSGFDLPTRKRMIAYLVSRIG